MYNKKNVCLSKATWHVYVATYLYRGDRGVSGVHPYIMYVYPYSAAAHLYSVPCTYIRALQGSSACVSNQRNNIHCMHVQL